MTWFDLLALILSTAGVATALLGLVFRLSPRACLPMALELWTAAGLLRLAGDPEVERIVGAAAVIAVRKLVVAALAGASPRTSRSTRAARP